MEVVARLLHILPAKKQLPKETATLERKSKKLIEEDGWVPPSFDPTSLRLVLYQDQDGRGKRQIFDSKAHLNATGATDDLSNSLHHPLTQSLYTAETSSKMAAASVTKGMSSSLKSRLSLIKRPSSDSELLGEMMFGSTPIKLVGNSVKIHYIRSEEQLMITKVFTAQKRMMASCSLTDFSDSCPLPSHRQLMKNHTFQCSLRPPSSSPDSIPQYYSQSYNPRSSPVLYNNTNSHYRISPAHTSIFSPLQSPTTSLPHSLTNSGGNLDYSPTQSLSQYIPTTSSLTSSLNRRIQRIRSTSLENGPDLYHRMARPVDQSSGANGSGRRGKLLAVGVIITLNNMNPMERQQFQEFFFSHFTLISSSMEQLREKIEEALWNRKPVLAELIMNAYNVFVNDIQLLYCSQRIKSPVWLEIVSNPVSRYDTCSQFLSQLSTLMHQLENKESKYFLSTVLTAVLSYHLAWVYTVSKSGSNPSRHHDGTPSKSLAVLAESHPYNPLWAQFGDMCGAVSDPLTICRTIVVGKSASLVCRLLYLLTYFIRCSEIHEDGGFIDDIISSSHVETNDTAEDNEIFQQESRTGSALTLLSESGRSSGNEKSKMAPLIKPHPFGIKAPSVSSTSSFDLSKNQVTQSCGSLDDISHQATPKPLRPHQDPLLSNICQSVPSHFIPPPNDKDLFNLGAYDPSPVSSSWSNNNNHSTNSNSSLLRDSVTDSLSTGCLTLSRNVSGGSLGGVVHAPPVVTSLKTGLRYGTSCSFDSGVYDQPPSLQGTTNDSCLRFTVGSLPYTGPPVGVPRPHPQVSSCPLAGHYSRIDPESSLTSSYNSNTLNSIRSSTHTHQPFNYTDSSSPYLSNSYNSNHHHYNPHINTTTSSSLRATSLSPRNTIMTNHYQWQDPSSSGATASDDHHIIATLSVPPTPMAGLKCTSSPSLLKNGGSLRNQGMVCNHSNEGLHRDHGNEGMVCNHSYKGLPVIEGVCPELEGPHNGGVTQFNDPLMSLRMQQINVQESLSPQSLSYLTPPSGRGSEINGGMKFQQQFKDFKHVEIENLESEMCRDVLLSPLPSPAQSFSHIPPQTNIHTTNTCLSDFGHSLMAGYSDKYMPHFVLHGTREPYTEFKDKLINDLSTVVKHSIIDEPVEHGVAIIADTDSLTCKVVSVSKSNRTIDGEILIGSARPSYSVQQLLRSVQQLWEMNLPPELCLSHLEDCLMSLNERGQIISNGLLEQMHTSSDVQVALQKLHAALNTSQSDEMLLHSLAGVHVSNTDHNLSKDLQVLCLHSLVK